MAIRSRGYKREALNQFINFFWTILSFAPVIWFWIKEGIDLYFYFFLATSVIVAIIPEKVLSYFTLSSSRRLYERLGVKHIRKFVQNGAIVNAMSNQEKRVTINGITEAKKYLRTIAMYERFHWFCFIFFLLTTILCFYRGRWRLALIITLANILYNVCAILLQQYNKIRIKKMIR